MDVVIGVEWQGTRTGEGMEGKERGNGRRRGEKGGDSTLSRLKSWVRHGQMQNASGRSLFMSRLYVFLNAKNVVKVAYILNIPWKSIAGKTSAK